MELSIDVTPEGDNAVAMDSGLSSPLGGKQRSLSLSEKWATNKALALEYLKRQREIMVWIESILKRKLPTSDLHDALKSGIVLRELMEVLFPQAAVNAISPISRKYSQRMAPWKERENISVFLKQCKALGMNDLSLFCTDDLYEGTNMVQVLFCVQHFMKFSTEHSGHDFQPIVKHSAAMSFSNQEVEMALSKLEQAGMNASALKDLIASATADDVEVRSGEVVDAISAPNEQGNILSTENKEKEEAGDEDVGEDEQIFEQLEQLEQELATGECNQALDSSTPIVADEEISAGTKDASPETESECDDADPADDLLDDPLQDSVVEGASTATSVQELSSLNVLAEHPTESAEEADELPPIDLKPEELTILVDVIGDIIADIEAASSEEIQIVELEEEEEEELEIKAEAVTVDSDVMISMPDQAFGSELNTELVDAGKSETAEVDSTVHAVPEEVTEVEQPAKKSKRKAKKRSKTKRARSSSEEQLEAEVMAKCTCGRGCTMM